MIKPEGVCFYMRTINDPPPYVPYSGGSEPSKPARKEEERGKEAPKEERERNPHDCICFSCSY